MKSKNTDIEQIKSTLIWLKNGGFSCQKESLDKDYGQHVNNCITAVQRLIAKSPDESNLYVQGYDGQKEYHCPICGMYLSDSMTGEYPNFCDECGQKISWSGK